MPNTPDAPYTPPYRDIPGYPTPTPPGSGSAPTPGTGSGPGTTPYPVDPGAPPASADGRSFFSDEARARLWRLAGDTLDRPPLIPGAALHLANLRSANEVSAMALCPSRAVNDQNRADLCGVAVSVDEASVQLVFQIAHNYPGAIAKEQNIPELGQYHGSYQGLGMYYNTLLSNAEDVRVTHQAYAKYISTTCDRILTSVREAAADGDPAAKAALPQIEDRPMHQACRSSQIPW